MIACKSCWLYRRRDIAEAQRDLSAWLGRWAGNYSKLTDRMEENMEETLTLSVWLALS
ncbi:Transposase, Mutator family [Nitrosovibrio tenuis]|uniref:Transposase, Mutator family n=1 Tax=Nitrosovibrio tenuis TaxID=1233 RepID=A0A1H7PES4_9PROT|nr:Transposase, Mutator family [Nitrosovibrio tenuis]